MPEQNPGAELAKAISRLTLAAYVRRRNGVPAGARGGLRNMLRSAFGAASFAGFWRHWTPVFGYALARYVHAPLRRALPDSLAQILTFVACGALHDAVTMLVRGAPALLFTPWFLLLGLGVVAGRTAGMNLSRWPWSSRALVHLLYLALCLVPAILLKRTLEL